MSPDLNIEYYVQTYDPASVSPFGVSELAGGVVEFALNGDEVQLRGTRMNDWEAQPLDYSTGTFATAVTTDASAIAAFRCVYDQKPR